MKRIIPTLLLIQLIISCNSTDLIKNNDIPQSIRENFKSKSDSIAMTVRTNNEDAYYLLGTENFYVKLNKETQPLKEIYWDPTIKSAPEVVDEFYITQEGVKNHELHSEKYGYTVHFANTQKESYVSVIKIHANEQQHYLLATVYGLNGKTWKLEKIIPARYSFFGYNANDMYKLAKEKEAKGFTIDAFVFANSAANLIRNGGKDLVFDNESEKIDFRNSLLNKLEKTHGKFPVDINEINTAPQLMGFDMAYHQKGLYTAVHYSSHISMYEVASLTEEYEKMKDYAAKNFPDLDNNQQFIFYRAFSTAPRPDGNFDIHGFVDENTRSLKK